MTTGQRLHAAQNVMERQRAQIEQLERQLRIAEKVRRLFVEKVRSLLKEGARKRNKLKREIELLRNSP